MQAFPGLRLITMDTSHLGHVLMGGAWILALSIAYTQKSEAWRKWGGEDNIDNPSCEGKAVGFDTLLGLGRSVGLHL
eukprot:g72399.t1